MNRSATLNNAIAQFATNLYYSKPIKYLSMYGYEYLIKGEKIAFKGSIHVNNDFESREFGNFENSSARLSTNIKLDLGNLIFQEKNVFVIKEQIYFNSTMGAYHYLLSSINDYYSCMLIDDMSQEFESLNSNISYLLLTQNYHIPIIPARFRPKNTENKYISFEILDTKAHSNVYFEKDKLRQAKSDNVRFYAVNCSTYDLQQFIYFLVNNRDFGNAGLPCFKAYQDDFNDETNLKSNIQELNIILNYNLSAVAVETNKLIESVSISINQILLRSDNERIS